MINPELDLTLLSVFCDKTTYKKYISIVDKASVSDETKIILGGFNIWYQSHDTLELSEFSPWFLSHYGRLQFSATEQTKYKHLLSRLCNIPHEAVEPILTSLKYRKCGEYILKKLNVNQLLGDQIYSLKEFDSHMIEQVLHNFNKSLHLEEEIYTNNFDEIYQNKELTGLNSGIKRLNTILHQYIPDFLYLVVAGYDGGKTAFCISEAASIVNQLVSTDGKILFFTNEQSSNMIKKRLIAAMLNKDNIEFSKFNDLVYTNKTKANDKFKKLGGGNIHIINIFGKTLSDIKKYCDKYEPKLIIIDQIDNIIDGKTLDGGARPYNNMYKRIRSEIAQVYAPVIGTTQAKNGGKIFNKDEGKLIYNENIASGDVHWSNVDKQANSDVIIGISVMNRDPSLRHIIVDRHKEGYTGNCYARLLPHSSRFIDI